MTNFVDTNFNTSATGGVIKYNLTHADNTTELVQLDIATPVQTQGTALNKVFFDSIRTDLTNLSNNKLNVSAKATQAQAEAGSDNTNYMTPLRVQQKFNSLISTSSGGSTGSVSLSGYTNQIVTIYGYGKYSSTSNTYSRVNGTGIQYHGTNTSSSSTTTYCNFNTYNSSASYPAFKIVIDFNSKTFSIESTCYTSSAGVYADVTLGTFSTLTSVSFSLGNTGSWSATVQVSN